MLRPFAHPECCMLLRVVMSCCAKFETGQTLNYVQTDATIPNNAGQRCSELLCPFARSLKVLLQHQSTFFTDFRQFKYGYRKYTLELL